MVDTIRDRRSAFGFFFLACFFFACNGGEEAESGTEVIHVLTDSAGTRIVESFRPSGRGAARWNIEAEPMFEIGSPGSDGFLFGSISDATRHSGGHIAVVDGMTLEIALFDPSGGFVRTIGRRGAGPGEFKSAPTIVWVASDTLLAWDPGSQRLSWFDLEGALVRERSLLLATGRESGFGIPGEGPDRWQVSPDGTVLSQAPVMERVNDEETRSRKRVSLLPAPRDTVVFLGEYGLKRMIRVRGWAVDNTFEHWPALALGSTPSRIFVAATEEWEIRVLNVAAEVAEIYRLGAPRAAVTSEMVRATRDGWRQRATGQGLAPSKYSRILNGFEVPDSLPAIHSIHVDGSGNLWVGRRQEADLVQPDEYLILDGSGRWIATAHIPHGIGYIIEVGEDVLLTVATGDLGVQRLRAHAVRRE